MFHELFSPMPVRVSRVVRRGTSVILSFILHVSALLGLIVVPLIRADAERPELKVTDISLGQIPPAPRPPKASGGKGKIRPGPKKPAPDPSHSGIPGPFIAPYEVPTHIEAEDLTFPSGGFGDGDGPAIDGVDDGDDIRSLLPPDLDNVSDNGGGLRVFKTPRLLNKVIPEYPEIARNIRIRKETVVLEAVTDIYGRVKDVRIVRGNPLFNEAAISAVRQWIYEPYLINGIPKPVTFTVTIHFSLEG